MNILIRADSSSTIGTGHIMRDLVLATQYPNDNVIFATQDLPGNINHKLKEKGYLVCPLRSHSLYELIEVIKQYEIHMIIIDHYGIDYEYEKKLKDITGVKIFVLDDTYERHYCDILLNHNISGTNQKYIGLVSDHCELRCGKKYTLIRDEFKEIRHARFRRKNLQLIDIFVAIGGADHTNILPSIIKVLSTCNFKNIVILTTTANRNLSQLKRIAKYKKNITLYINSDQVAKLMSISKLIITSPSVMLNEVFYLQKPFIAIKTAENQDDMSNYLSNRGFSVLAKMNRKKLLNLLVS